MAGPIWPGAGGVAIFRRFKFSSHSPHDVSGTRTSMRLQSRKAGPEADICHTAYPPVIKITNATFYREYPTTESVKKDNPPLYPNLTFSLKSYKVPTKAGEYSSLEHCAVIGSSAKSSFLDILRGRYICVPPTARSYPYLLSPGARAEVSSCDAAHAIQYVGFNVDQKQSAGGIRGSYMSARYESRREDTDFTLLQYLKDQTSLNPLVREKEDLREAGNIRTSESGEHLNQIIRDFQLQELLNMPVSNLSNGQTRRARIAKALLMKPEVLLLDEPFMGLDRSAVPNLSRLLYLATLNRGLRMVLALRPQDPIPSWVSQIILLVPDNTVALQGTRDEVFRSLEVWQAVASREAKTTFSTTISEENSRVSRTNLAHSGLVELMPRSNDEERRYQLLPFPQRMEYDKLEQLRENGRFGDYANILHEMGMLYKQPEEIEKKVAPLGEPIVEMDGVRVKYGDKVVLGGWTQVIDGGMTKKGLCWKVHRGQRWGVFGSNGSGKTTLISLITSDHPQTYSQPVQLFGRSRLPEPGKPGISIFDLQSRIGHSSPEIHAFFPRHLSLRATIESAWAETFLSKPKVTPERIMDIDSALRFFEADLNPSFSPCHDPMQATTTWADSLTFSSLTPAQQRVALFLRAIIHKPDLIILDEAFSSMGSSLRDKCLHFLEVGEHQHMSSSGTRRTPNYANVWHLPPPLSSTGPKLRHTGISDHQALIVISHVKEEVPDIVSQWMRLPTPARTTEKSFVSDEAADPVINFQIGQLAAHESVAMRAWEMIWNISAEKRGEFQAGGVDKKVGGCGV
ncbi:ABC transporter [Histoplasma capsulatum H143]|uniref:ABC transporter n=1 Tax=Ajellomyces capsulatus (strain H143) TaxID=544712 RepID=C6HF12_AJECH|nr:ABC transporter [Histoplasma capsulatum H143]